MTSEVDAVKIAPEFGRHLIGRDVGFAIRRKYFGGDPPAWPRALDFRGVEQATESCIDELLAPLAREHGLGNVHAIQLRGLNRAVDSTVKYVFDLLQQPPTTVDGAAARVLLEGSKSRTPKRTSKIGKGAKK